MARLAAAVLFFSLAAHAAGQVVTVNDTGDSSNPCAASGTGTCTLRDAITYANSQVESTIVFGIAGAGVHTIAPASALPTIVKRVTIEGYSQPGSSPSSSPPEQGSNAVILIEIDGTNTGGAFDGRVIGVGAGSNGTVIRGLVINRGHAGVRVDAASDVVIEGCFIGTDPSGTTPLPNAEAGVILTSGATNATVGGLTAAARNLISANGIDGINVGTDNGMGGTGHLFVGNLIGTDATGTLALSGTQTGIELAGTSSNVRIGGTSPAERNVISGNAGGGIRLRDPGTGNLVQGNFIGTDVTGTLRLGNGSYGISVEGPGNTIGGAAGGAGNLVSANAVDGIDISGNDTVVMGNSIGTGPLQLEDLRNGGWGIRISANGATIGGFSLGQGNTIESNGTGATGGVSIASGTGNTVSGNVIWLNTGLGIDLGSFGVDANDAGDVDAGPNQLQNFPIISSFSPGASGGTDIHGVLHAAPSTTYRIDFYGNPACAARPHDFLQGSYPIGFTTVLTSSVSATATFDVNVPGSGDQISATATDPDGNTSEFSQRMVFSVSPPSGPADAGTPITITGTDFLDGATVSIGATAATGVGVGSFTQMTATTPVLAPGTVHDVSVVNTDGSAGTLLNGWVADFLDVPTAQQFHAFVTTLVANGITAGVGGGLYGVNDDTLRQQMAVFLLKAKVRALLHAAALHARLLRRRPLPVDVRGVDRGAGQRGHHGRLRRRQLLSAEPGAPRSDGRVPAEGRARPDVTRRRPARPGCSSTLPARARSATGSSSSPPRTSRAVAEAGTTARPTRTTGGRWRCSSSRRSACSSGAENVGAGRRQGSFGLRPQDEREYRPA